jgi:DNA ligase-1
MNNIMFMRADSYINRKTRLPQHSCIGYYLSEKYDGQRVQWRPEIQSLISRYGNTISAPSWFIEPLKQITIPLDGELFIGYGKWSLTGLFRTHDVKNEAWKQVTFIVFDYPSHLAGSWLQRQEKLRSILEDISAQHVKMIKPQLIISKEMIENTFKTIISRGGEGLMLNDPHAFYQEGKSQSILKYKQIMDEQAIIVGYKMGKGRLEGKLGSFVVHPIDDGHIYPKREFSVSGMSDEVRNSFTVTHPIGTIIDYTCSELTPNGRPRHPIYKGVCRKIVLPKRASITNNVTETNHLALDCRTVSTHPSLKI